MIPIGDKLYLISDHLTGNQFLIPIDISIPTAPTYSTTYDMGVNHDIIAHAAINFNYGSDGTDHGVSNTMSEISYIYIDHQRKHRSL